jgi:chromosome segregation ATPase
VISRIKKIISCLENRKRKIEETIIVQMQKQQELMKQREELFRIIKGIQNEFFKKIMDGDIVKQNSEYRYRIEFYKSRIAIIDENSMDIKRYITELKHELQTIRMQLKSMEKYYSRIQQEEKKQASKREDKEIEDTYLVNYFEK